MKTIISVLLVLLFTVSIAQAGGYHVQPLTFEVVAYNGHSSDVDAVSDTYTTSYRSRGHRHGGAVYDNDIETVAIGANANLDVEVDCRCKGKYFKVTARNYGDVSAQSNTWSNVGSVSYNTISTVAIGANASGSYTSGH